MKLSTTLKISQKHNFSQVFWEVVENVSHLNIVIDDIKADRTINIEIQQFFSICDVFKHISEKRKRIVAQLAQTDDYEPRKVLYERLEKAEQEEKQYRIDILLTANGFTNIKHNEVLQEVADLFFEGNTQAAFKTLNPQALESTQAKIIELLKTEIEIEKTRDRLEDNANEFKVKAQLSTFNLEIKNPEDRFEKSLFFFEKGKKSAEYTRRKSFYSAYAFDYALFLQKHNQSNKAQPLYEEALQMRRQLAAQDPQTYLPDVAITLNNLANLYSNRNEFNQAQVLFEEVLQLDRQLAKANPRIYLPNVANSLNNWAVLYSVRNEFHHSRALYEESLQIRRQLAEMDPQTHLPNLAIALNNLAILYKEIRVCLKIKKSWKMGISC